MNAIKHKTLGTFRQEDYFGDTRWSAKVAMPAFAVFKDYREKKARRSNKIDIHVLQETPSKSAFSMLTKIKTNQKALVKKIKLAFFNDFNRIGPDSGMWWRHDPIELALACREAMDAKFGRERICFPDDLDVLLYAPSIEIHNSSEKGITTLIELGSVFEGEHGTSVLTDGKKVLGLGYSGEASEYSTNSECPHCGSKLK